MRAFAIIPLSCLLAGCLAPGQRDPTRYPWDPRNTPALSPAPHPRIDARGLVPRFYTPPSPATPPVPGAPSLGPSFCIMAIEQERASGITVSANSGVMTCTVQPNSAPKAAPR